MRLERCNCLGLHCKALICSSVSPLPLSPEMRSGSHFRSFLHFIGFTSRNFWICWRELLNFCWLQRDLRLSHLHQSVSVLWLAIHHKLNGAFSLTMQGEGCKFTLIARQSLKVWETLHCSVWPFKWKKDAILPVYLWRHRMAQQSLYILKLPLYSITSMIWSFCIASWWDNLIFRALFINKLCTIYLVFCRIYESKVQSAPKITHSSKYFFPWYNWLTHHGSSRDTLLTKVGLAWKSKAALPQLGKFNFSLNIQMILWNSVLVGRIAAKWGSSTQFHVVIISSYSRLMDYLLINMPPSNWFGNLATLWGL